jgi:hypothetical protein
MNRISLSSLSWDECGSVVAYLLEHICSLYEYVEGGVGKSTSRGDSFEFILRCRTHAHFHQQWRCQLNALFERLHEAEQTISPDYLACRKQMTMNEKPTHQD